MRVQAELRDEQGRPLANTPVRVVTSLLRGGTRVVGEGRTDTSGRVEVPIEDLGSGPHTLALEAYHRNAYRVVAAEPVPEGLTFVVFEPVRVTASKVADIDDVALHGRRVAPDAGHRVRPGEVTMPSGGLRPIEPDGDLPPPKELVQLQEQLQVTVRERDLANQQLAATVQERDRVASQLEHSLAERDAVQKSLEALQGDVSGLRDNLQRLESTNARLAEEQAGLQLQADGLRQELLEVARQRDTHLRDLEDERIRVRDLEDQLDAEQAAEIAVTELLARTGEQFGEVNDRLGTSSSAYRLGDVQVEMKVLLSPDSKRARLPGLLDLADTDAGGFTVLTIDFERPTPTTAVDEPVVPDVRGYTSPMAQRRLQSAGLRARTVAQYVPEERAAADHGRVLEQRPGPGQQLAAGSEVELLVGRAER